MGAMRRIPAAWLVVLSVMGGCAAEPFEGETAACRCEAEPGCAATDCPVEVVLSERCAGAVPYAEVLIDGHLETGVARPGEVMTACSQIPLGGTARVAARGGEWLWGPLDEACTVAGEVRRLVFDCSEFGAPVSGPDASSEAAVVSPETPDAETPETGGEPADAATD